ncbi:hypothetical protein KIN20_015583 [Parelaphostrongylus tenuis]|uniref:Uncharacterized protein n=1 Tax=Parelaphostrongylus tenuis TaxID=148309 RepID=A0AAD5N0H8_PARTN|nr:hypothetical protein KIN20_015583 [Parelaphostrongylus tenuis]
MKERAEASRERAENERETMATELREVKLKLGLQHTLEVEINQLKADKECLEKKVFYLNENLREIHLDYRAELAQLVRQIGEKKHKDVTGEEMYNIDKRKAQIAQINSVSRSTKWKLKELQDENKALRKEVSAGIVREFKTSNENKKLRGGLVEALAKLERYKSEAERSKGMCKEMAEQLGSNEERICQLEQKVMNLGEIFKEKEKLDAYLQSQIKTKDMPKLS